MMEQLQPVFVLRGSTLTNRLGLFDVDVESLDGAAGPGSARGVRQPHPAVDVLVATLRP
jgi:hypothetical protein